MNKARALLFSGVASLGLAFQAHAQNTANDDKLIAMNDVNVEMPAERIGIMNLRDDDLRIAKVKAAKESKGSIVLFYMGNDEDLANKIRESGTLAKAKGLPVKGMVLAKPDPDFDGDSYFVLMGGIPINKQADPRDHTADEIRQFIQISFAEHSEKLGIASAGKPSTNAVAVNNDDRQP